MLCCPLTLNLQGTLGTVDYHAPCGCVTMCELTECKYTTDGLLVKFNALGSTETNTVSIVAPKCGGSMALVTTAGVLVANSTLTAGTVYTVYPQRINGILRGVVAGL
jgi:hypothetical protein